LSANIWFDLWLAQWLYGSAWPNLWSGSFTSLNSSGENFGNTIQIPNYPDLVGLELSHVGLCLEGGYPGNLKELTEVHTFKFWPMPVDQAPGDDTSHLVDLGFSFPFYGQNYTQVYVNANGNLTFGSGDSDFSETEAEMLSDQPRIAAIWDDLGPHQGGKLFVKTIDRNERELVVEWVNVPQLSASDFNTVRVILRPDGSIKMQYRDVDLQDSIVGISPGNGISSASQIDLSTSGYRTSSGAMFEQFDASSPLDITSGGTIWWSDIVFEPTSSSATSYTLKTNIAP